MLQKVLLEYVWIDGFGKPRSKTKVILRDSLNWVKNELEETPSASILPEWDFDGSSTGQAPGNNSEVVLKPCAVYLDPFRKVSPKCPHCFLVLCETYCSNGAPHLTNTRKSANTLFQKHKELVPRFGIEQEFFISKNRKPIGFSGNPLPQQHYYCGTGGDWMIGREQVEVTLRRLLYAGLNVTGLNAEVAPSQWEFQICADGISAADQVIMARYILDRTLEEYGCHLDLQPKPMKGDWNGSGCHTNFSTKPMREKGGYALILKAIKKLEATHAEHMKYYGANNDLRMTGEHETARYDTFTYGVANRGCSVRIPKSTEKDQCGYLEDRRPASNMDPYVVTLLIFRTTL